METEAYERRKQELERDRKGREKHATRHGSMADEAHAAPDRLRIYLHTAALTLAR